jgi:hypothetical protein
MLMHPEPRADLLALNTPCTEQDHPAAVRQRARRLVPPNLSLEKAALLGAQNHFVCHPTHHTISPQQLLGSMI